MTSNYVISAIRTGAALLAGWLATLLAAHLGIVLDAHSEAVLAAFFALAFSFVWYLVVRVLEHRWPVLGVLLGIPRKPTYEPPK